MANSEKISEIIDPAAFKQLEDLLRDLGLIQKQFVSVTGEVVNLNNEIAKSKSMGELTKSSEAAAAAAAKVTQAQSEQVKQAQKVVEVEKQIVEATKQKLTVSAMDDKALKKVSGSLDEQIRRQLQLKLELSAVREEQKKVNSSTASSAASIKAMSDRLGQLAKEEALLKNAISQNNTEIRRSVREQNAAETSLDAMSARLDSLRGAYRSLNNEERENVEIGGLLLSQIQQLDSELKAFDKTLGVHNRNVGNYESALAGLGGPIGNIIGGFTQLVDVADNLNESMEKGEGGFSTFTDGFKSITRAAWAFIATPIGATIAGITAALLAAKGWYDYNKGLVEATRLTKQFTGLSGDDLKSFRTEVQATATVFDKEFNEILLASNNVAKQFGISQSESLELVRKGFVSGADANGEFLDQLREYPALLHEVGVSAEQTVAIITQNVKDGIYSDKGIDAIKEAGISLREMTKSTKAALDGIGLSSVGIQKELTEGTTTVFEVIQRISNRLKELPPQSAQVGTAIADIFRGAGEDAGLAYLTTLGNINTNLDETVKQMGAVAEAELKQLEATEKLDKTFAALFDVTGGGFELLLANTKLYATNFAIAILENLVKAINYTVDFYNESQVLRGVIQSLAVAFTTVFNIVKTGYQFMFESTKTIAQLIRAAITGNFDDIGAILVAAGKRNVKLATDLGKTLGKNVSDAYISTVTGRLSRVTLGLDTTGAAGVAVPKTAAGGGDFTPAVDAKAAAKAAEREKKRVQAELALATYRATTLADIAKREAENTSLSYDARIQASERWVEQQEKVLAAERDQAVQAAEFPAQATKAEEEYTNKLGELKRQQGAIIGKAFDDELNAIKLRMSEEDALRVERAAKESQALRESEQLAIESLTKRFLSGDISEKEYQQRRLDLQAQYSQKYVQQEIDEVARLIEINKARGIDTATQERDLAALRLKLSQQVTDKQIDDAKKVLEREKEINEARKELAQEAANLAFGLMDARFERQQQEVEQQIEDLDKQTQAEINAVNQSTLTEEQKTIRIAQIEAKAQVQREQLEARQRAIQLKQAKFDRAANIAGIVGNTARGVTSALAMFPPNVPLSILIGAIGAAQIASVLAQPLPRFFTGTESSPEGFAHIGEKGAELMVTPDGKLTMSPKTDTITYLQKGTKIFDADKTKAILAASTVAGVPDKGTFVTNNIDIERLVKATKDGTKELKDMFNKKVEHRTILTKSGLRNIVVRGNKWNDYKNRNIK